MPEPTPEITRLVALLGDDVFVVREEADKKLRALGWEALKAVSTAQKHADLEVRYRAKAIYESYFAVTARSEKIPSIWFMETKTRFPKGYGELRIHDDCSLCNIIKEKDVAKEYYEKIAGQKNDYQNEDIGIEATRLYVRDLLMAGMKRGEVATILDAMEKTSETHALYRQSESLELYHFDWQNTPYGPILPKEDFKDPEILGPA